MRALRMPALLLAIAACTSDDPAGPDTALPECSGPVSVDVSSGTSPTFDWTPRCRAFFLLVELGAGDEWLVLSEGRNAIAPPVRYGQVPHGAIERDPATPLVPGQLYDVNLARWTGPGGDDGVLIANREFTP